MTVISIANFIKNAGLEMKIEDLGDGVMGEVRDDSLLLNKNIKSKADPKIIFSCLLIMHGYGIRGTLNDGFNHNGEFINEMLGEAVDLVLPRDVYESGEKILWKEHKIGMDTINLQRTRWQIFKTQEGDKSDGIQVDSPF
ncbi:hypothetical protein phiOC_p150 [Ochrobactrum phage vB_OspM_OC]|nr:hypothetical protein phiOC_p150 [Ochrobactrum phage vB_OspM_OC]